MDGNAVLNIAMILGITEFAKKFGLDGKWTILFTVALAFVLGFGGELAAQNAQWLFWYNLVVRNIGFALTAGGFYDIGKKALLGGKDALRQLTFK